MQANLVEVKLIPKKKWHGKANKEDFSRPKSIEVLYSANEGRYITGLTEEQEAKYSKMLGVDLSDRFNPDTPHPYWSTKPSFIKLTSHTLTLDKNKPAEFVKVCNLKVSKYVANSLKEWEDGLWPFATHYIFDEEQEVKVKSSKIQIRNKIIAILSKMTRDDKNNIIQILSKKNCKGRSDDFVDVELDDIIENKPTEFLKYATMGKEEVYVRAAVLECILKNILIQEGQQIFYMGDLIAIDYEGAVDWFKDEQNSKIKVSILEKLSK